MATKLTISDKLSSRKFLFSLVIVIASTFSLSNSLIGEDSWVNVIKFIIAAYILGNVGQAAVTAYQDIKTPKIETKDSSIIEDEKIHQETENK